MAEDGQLVVCADIGSVPNRKFAWATSSAASGDNIEGLAATTVRSTWGEIKPLLLWEAFVSGDRKPASDGGHRADAAAGVDAFRRRRTLRTPPDTDNSNATSEGIDNSPVNLLALLASWARLDIDEAEQRQAFPIYAPEQSRKAR